MYLRLLLLFTPFCWAYYTFKNSPIEMIDHKVWKKIAKGEDPWIWMINFYCKKGEKDAQNKCDKSYDLRNEYTDAVHMLKGFVRPAAYKVKADFPAFVRVPSVMLYMPNSTEPYVYEMENFPEEVKRPSYRLVQHVKDIIFNHIDSAQIRNVQSSWKFTALTKGVMQKIVKNDVPNQCYFVLLYETIPKNKYLIQLLAVVATAVRHVYGIPESQLNFGGANIEKVKEALSDWEGALECVAPKFWFFGPRNAPQTKHLTFSYNGRMDAADITRWVLSRHADMMIIPGNTVQINVRREAGFVGQVIEIEQKRFFLGTI